MYVLYIVRLLGERGKVAIISNKRSRLWVESTDMYIHICMYICRRLLFALIMIYQSDGINSPTYLEINNRGISQLFF